MIIVNAAALYGNAQRYAVGERGSIFFLFDAKWSPPGGWWFTTLVALVGLGTLAMAGFLDPQGTPRSQATRVDPCQPDGEGLRWRCPEALMFMFSDYVAGMPPFRPMMFGGGP